MRPYQLYTNAINWLLWIDLNAVYADSLITSKVIRIGFSLISTFSINEWKSYWQVTKLLQLYFDVHTVIVILDNDVSGEILLLHLYSEPSLHSWECGFRHRGVYDGISRHYHSHSFQSNLHKPQPKSFSTFLSLDNHKPVCKMKGERNTKLLKVLHQHITRIALCSLFIFDFVCPVKSPIWFKLHF